MEPFFSIILPAYNAEHFLAHSLDSIISQDFQDYELLVVNDGSVDGTLAICEQYAKIHPQLILINKENEGVSVARNFALDIAKGTYLLFVDADDILFPDALKTIHDSLLQKPVDYLRYEFQTIDQNGVDLYPNYEARARRNYANLVIDSSKCLHWLVRNEFFLWCSAFRREIIEEHHLRFLKGCTYNEDTLFICEYLSISRKAYYIDSVQYGYRKTPDAVTFKFTSKNFVDVMSVCERLMLLSESQEEIFGKEIEKVAQCLALHLYEEKALCSDGQRYTNVITACLRHPLLFEWKVYRVLGEKAVLLWHFHTFINKILRRL